MEQITGRPNGPEIATSTSPSHNCSRVGVLGYICTCKGPAGLTPDSQECGSRMCIITCNSVAVVDPPAGLAVISSLCNPTTNWGNSTNIGSPADNPVNRSEESLSPSNTSE